MRSPERLARSCRSLRDVPRCHRLCNFACFGSCSLGCISTVAVEMQPILRAGDRYVTFLDVMVRTSTDGFVSRCTQSCKNDGQFQEHLTVYIPGAWDLTAER